MRRRLLPHLTYANVMSTLAAFFALAGGAAYAANTVFSSDITDNQVYSADVRNDNLSGGGLGGIDIANDGVTTLDVRDDTQGFGGLFAQDLGPGSVRASEVQDGSLKDEDIGERAVVDAYMSIGGVDAQECKYVTLPAGVDVSGDHLVLTPDLNTASPNLIYSVERYTSIAGNDALIKACNPTTEDVFDGGTIFDLLVIEDQ